MSAVFLSELLRLGGVEVRGELDPATRFRRIAYHSKRDVSGSLFIALVGEQVDGHVFVADAAANGAVAALVARRWADEQANPPLPLLVVDDPVAKLQELGRARRELLPEMLVVGVTGSVGKTSTKEIIASVVARQFRTFKNPGNLNSEIGLPLAMLEVPPETEVGVFEMAGAWVLRELALIADIARPKIGVVINVHPVHLERMGSIEAIADSKAELIEALPEDGIAILNGDDPIVRTFADRTRARVLTYGLDPSNDISVSNLVTLGLEGSEFWVHIEGERYYIKVPMIGGHAVELALAAIAVGHALGMHISEMLPGFADATTQIRLIVTQGPNGSRILDDTYNASTPSMLSALSLLEEVGDKRKLAVLGDMRELGEVSEIEHRKIGRRVAGIVDRLYTYGELARTIAEEAIQTAAIEGREVEVESFAANETERLIETLRAELAAGDLMLVKGSRGLEMENIVAALREPAIEEEDGP
ncbi:MAG: UDP-N-acetylmuramoyl-tripeptide--D-alanyl-D-alanine ligase [Thermomicrobiales bacterium]|nr:UDP-N-acetylmuramoyl-tripeptide--D-alanyl-D-alanine ligase [Thermomicrobiales bacterium]